MRKKSLIAVAATLAVALSIGCAQATNITGATGSGSNYQVKPEKINGNIGYRKYSNFELSKNHNLNMDFNGTVKQGGVDVSRDVATFINLVGSKVQIDGVLNSTQNGNFYNGNAIFIAPGGFAVGSSGVVNVGQLHVATPSSTTYNKLVKDYDNKNVNAQIECLKGINNISKIKQDSNADVQIDGKVFAKTAVDLRGQNVTVNGDIVNGVAKDSMYDSTFNELVNTDGFGTETGKNAILIKAQKKGGITVGENAHIVNGDSAQVYLTNDGSRGITVNGALKAKDSEVRIYNKAGDLTTGSTAKLEASTLDIGNDSKAGALTMAGRAEGDAIYVAQKGTGAVNVAADMDSASDIAINNKGKASMTVGGDVKAAGVIAINNYTGDLTIDGAVESTGDNVAIHQKAAKGEFVVTDAASVKGPKVVKLYNLGENGMTMNGTVASTDEMTPQNVILMNTNGKLTVGGKVENEVGNIYITTKEKATGMELAEGSKVLSESGNIAIKNASGKDGLVAAGKVENGSGTTAINNYAGDLEVARTADLSIVEGNMGVINRKEAGKYTIAKDAQIKVDGQANLKQFAAADMDVAGEFTNSGRVNVVANDGQLTMSSKVNNGDGVFYAVSRYEADGFKATEDFRAEGGEIILKNYNGENGFVFDGEVATENAQATLVNKTGDMKINGKVAADNDLVYIKNGGNSLEFERNAEIISDQKGTILNYGKHKVQGMENIEGANMELKDRAVED